MGSLLAPANVTTPNERIVALRHHGSYVGVLHHNSKVIQIYQMRLHDESQRKKQRRLRRRREKQGKPEVKSKGPKHGIMDNDDDNLPVQEDCGGDSLDQSIRVDDMKALDEFEYYGVIRTTHKIRDFALTGQDC